MVQKHKALQKQPRIICKGARHDMENQDQNNDNRHCADDYRIYYDDPNDRGTNNSHLRLGFPYLLFYFWH